MASTTTTDDTGHYSVPDVPMPAGSVWLLVGASKAGHFADFIWWMDFPNDNRFDLQLDPLVHIPVGETVQGGAFGALCAGLGYGGWYGRTPCQRFAVTVPQSGILDVTISAPVFNFDVDVVRPDGTFAGYAASGDSPLQLSAAVEAGSTYEVRVAALGSAISFDLKTALR